MRVNEKKDILGILWYIYIPFGLNIKSNVFNHRSFSVQCTIRYYIFVSVSVFVCIRFLVLFVFGSIVFIDGTIYMHTVYGMMVVYSLSQLPLLENPNFVFGLS